MKRALVALVSLLLVTGVAAEALGRWRGSGPIYSVAAVQAGLARDPGAWVNRTLRVRGIAQPCGGMLDGPSGFCYGGLPVLVDDKIAGPGIQFGRGRPNPLYAALRHIPRLGNMVPPPAEFFWSRPATYSVEIVVDTMPAFGTGAAYEALLQDAAP
jgi:hypothetical protein